MPGTAKDRALRLLSVRARSSEEVRRRLLHAGFPEAEVAEAVADLEAVGLLDDERFAQEVAVSRLQRRGYGRRAAVSDLRSAGVTMEVAERAVEAAAGGEEEARAEEIARARAARLDGLAPEVAHRRLMGFLARRGFDPEIAWTAARRALGSEDDGP